MARKMVGEVVSMLGSKELDEKSTSMQPAAEVQDLGGDEITIILGQEKYAPVQYHSFDVGPFIVKTTRRPGETVAEVYERLMPELRACSQRAFDEALPRFLERVRAAAAAARGVR